MTIWVAAAPGVVGERNELRLRMEDAAHHPLTGARIWVRLDMPAMPMHRSPLVLEEQARGTYVNSSPDFDMGGDWSADVTAATADGRLIHGRVDLEIRD